MNLCECGCGRTVDVRFVWGHNRKGCETNNLGTGWKHKPETIEKMRKPHSEEHNRKVSDALRGKPKSLEHCKSLSEAHKGLPSQNTLDGNEKISKTVKKIWANRTKEEKEKIFRKIFRKNAFKPNGLEIEFDKFLHRNFPKEWKYVGNGGTFINGRCPDWININGKKLLIELFSNYFHSEKITGRTKKQEEKQRIEHFKKCGFDTVVVWEDELKNLENVKEKILRR